MHLGLSNALLINGTVNTALTVAVTGNVADMSFATNKVANSNYLSSPHTLSQQHRVNLQHRGIQMPYTRKGTIFGILNIPQQPYTSLHSATTPPPPALFV